MKIIFQSLLLPITALLLLSSYVANAANSNNNEDCLGEIIEDTSITKLDLFHSEVTTNTLHLPGGELRYGNVGVVRDRTVDLVVTITDGEYTDILSVWEERDKDVLTMNGRKEDSQFGSINLQTVKDKPRSGEGNFRFCFRDQETNELTKVDTFRWSVFDLDDRWDDKTQEGISIKEKMIVDVGQAMLYQLWPNPEESEVQMSCEDGSTDLPCPPGVRTVFHSSTVGTGKDNPNDPSNMTDQQKRRSIAFTFRDTDCWEFTYDHYCPVEQDHDKVFPLGYDPQYNTGNNKNYDTNHCRGYTGGNFLFSGDADEIIDEGECITPPPTDSPTTSPTVNPTSSPTAGPTTSPTSSPTAGPTVSPTEIPSSSPTTANPTKSPTVMPSATPTVAHSDMPSDGPSLNPSSEPSSMPSDGPSLSPSAAQTEIPIITPLPTTMRPTTEASSTTDAPTLVVPNDDNSKPPIVTNGEEDDDDDFFLPSICPDDLTLVNQVGVTKIRNNNDLTAAVQIISQDTSTVTVKLNQAWTSSSSSSSSSSPDDEESKQTIDHIYYSFKEDSFEQVCYEETNVASDVMYTTTTTTATTTANNHHPDDDTTDGGSSITIQCMVEKPFALLEICVADEAVKNVLSFPKDNAIVPQCCHPTFPENTTPVVCYTIEIKCESQCIEEEVKERKNKKKRGLLRGSSPSSFRR
jgi:hypothetical protein